MLYIVRGLPGSGKSTYAKQMGCFHVEADMYHMKDGKYQFRKEALADAHDWCQMQVDNAIRTDVDVVVSNTFTTPKEVEPYVEMAKYYGIPYKIIAMDNDFGNVHNVPEDTLAKMKARWKPIEGEIVVKFAIDS